jgi:AAA15 family ATPase/GTPase
MNRCIELMLESSKKNQIFITTHSLEFLQKIIEKAKEKSIDLKVFSISNLKDGIVEYNSYDLDEAYAAVNKIGVDLR